MNKPNLIILHGWGSDRQKWGPFINMAKHDCNIHFISLPCFDGEPCPKEVWGVKEYANFVKTKIIDLKLDNKNTILLGHSFGGAIATQLMATNPNIAHKLILVAAAVVRPKNKIKRKIFGTFARVGKWVFDIPFLKKHQRLAQKILYKGASSPDYTNTSGIKRDIFKKIIRQDLTHILGQITTETLVLWGTKDTLTPLKHGKKISALLPNAKCILMKEAKHGLHHKKYVDTTYKHIHDFIFST